MGGGAIADGIFSTLQFVTRHLPDDARSTVDAQSSPDAHSLMQEYSAEAARLVAAQESEHAASLVRLSSRRQQPPTPN